MIKAPVRQTGAEDKAEQAIVSLMEILPQACTCLNSPDCQKEPSPFGHWCKHCTTPTVRQ